MGNIVRVAREKKGKRTGDLLKETLGDVVSIIIIVSGL